MNIKYISILSLFCFATASADRHHGNMFYQPKTDSLIEKFDRTKKARIDCDTRKMRQSLWSKLTEGCINCEKEKKEFEAAFAELREEFKTALAKGDLETAQLLQEKI